MSTKQVENLVEKLAGEIIADTQLEIVDVEYTKERNWFLRVFLDKPGGLEVDDCQWVSERLSERLDELDPIKESYFLEVSSPGIDRPLKKEKDYIRHKGDKVEVHTFAPFNGRKEVVGTLIGLTEQEVKLDVDGLETGIPRDKVSQVRLYVDF